MTAHRIAGSLALTVHGGRGAEDLVVPPDATAMDVAREYAGQLGLAHVPPLLTALGESLRPDDVLSARGVVSGDLLAIAEPAVGEAARHRRGVRRESAPDLLAPLLLTPAALSAAPAVAADSVIELVTDQALDGTGGKLHNARILVKGGKILSLSGPKGGPSIDLRGYTVLPGWIDAHVHIASHFDRTGHLATNKEPEADAILEMEEAAWRTLMAGFTTIESVGDPSDARLRDALRAQGLPGPRLLTSLAPIEGDLSKATPEQLRAMVRERKAQGADLIKIFASSSQRVGAKPTLTEEQLKALCGEATAVGLRSMVHAYRGQVANAARAGCRDIEHATYASPEDLQVAVQAGAYLTPQVGLVVQNYIHNQDRYVGIEGYTAEGMQVMLRDMPEDFKVCTQLTHMAGAKVVFGTDATAGAHGRNAEEMIGRVEHCGATPMAVLVSASSLAAEAATPADWARGVSASPLPPPQALSSPLRAIAQVPSTARQPAPVPMRIALPLQKVGGC